MAVLMEGEELKARGVDVVDFGPGEPDFATPEHIKKAAIEALPQNRTKYTATAGHRAVARGRLPVAPRAAGQLLRVRRVRRHRRRQARHLQCRHRARSKRATKSSSPRLTGSAIRTSCNLAGGAPVFVPTDASDGFILRAEQVEPAITPRTRMVIVNSPNNPTGAVIPPDEFERIYEVCRRAGVLLMTDECYSHFTYGAAKPYSIASRRRFQTQPHRGRLALENICDDRLARRLRPGSQAADGRHDQDSEPVHLQPHVHRAIRGAGGAHRPHGFGSGDARRIRAAPAAHPCRPQRYSRRHLCRAVPARSTPFRTFPRGSVPAKTPWRWANSFSNASTSWSCPATPSALRDSCVSPTPLPSSASTRVCGAWSNSSRAAAIAATWTAGSFAAGAHLRAAHLGRAQPRAAFRHSPVRAGSEPIGEVWMTGEQCAVRLPARSPGNLWPSLAALSAEWTGTALRGLPRIPLLVKFIFPEDKLSLQVHPGDEYARAARSRRRRHRQNRDVVCGLRSPRSRSALGLQAWRHAARAFAAPSTDGTADELPARVPVRAE